MSRWICWVLGLGLCLGMTIGCGPKVFLAEKDFNDARHLIPASLEEGHALSPAAPLTALVPTPADVNNSDRPARYMTLQEVIAIALENGSTAGRGSGVGSGIADDSLAQFTGGSTTGQSDRIRVLSMNMAISYASLEQSLARYDAMVVSTLNWAVTDSLTQGLSSFSNGQDANFNMSIVKAFASGGVASIGFENNYRFLSEPPTAFGVFNPFYTSQFKIGFEQPLLRDAGVGINQLLNRSPGATGGGIPGEVAGAFNSRQQVLQQGPGSFGGTASEGILIARLRLDAQKSEFERNVNNMLLNVEVAYWNLYQAYGQLYSFEEVMRIAHRAWLINLAKYKAGTKGPADYFPVLGQYEEFRGQRIAALGEVLDKERNLRRLIGLPIEDGARIVPITPPTLAPFLPDWGTARQEALQRRPELAIARDNVRALQYNLIVAKNFLMPDLRFFAQYAPIGFGTELTGGSILTDARGDTHPSSSLGGLQSDHFNNWRIGLNFTMPLGFRTETAAVRAARLSLAQAYEALKDQEERATSVLSTQYQKLAEWYRLIEARRAERKAYTETVEARFREYAAGKATVSDFLLEAQRRLAAAQVKEYQAIAEYNSTLARFEWSKGNLMAHNNVHIAEGALPQCAQVRAVEHELKRSQALVLCERPDSIYHPGRLVAACEKDVLAMPPAEGGAVILPENAGPKVAEQLQVVPRPLVTLPAEGKTEPMIPQRIEAAPPSSTPEFVPAASPTRLPSVPMNDAPPASPLEIINGQPGNLPPAPPLPPNP